MVLTPTMLNGVPTVQPFLSSGGRMQRGGIPPTDMLKCLIFGSIVRTAHRRAKIMVLYYMQLFMYNRLSLIPLTMKTLIKRGQGKQLFIEIYLFTGADK